MLLSRIYTLLLLLLSAPALGAGVHGDDPQDGRIEIVEETVYWHHPGGIVSDARYLAEKGFRLQLCSADGQCSDLQFKVAARGVGGVATERSVRILPMAYMPILAREWHPFWQSTDSDFMPIHQAVLGDTDINVGDFPEWKQRLVAYVSDVLDKSFASELVFRYVDQPPLDQVQSPRPVHQVAELPPEEDPGVEDLVPAIHGVIEYLQDTVE